jgi:ankyrin repeat protein
MKRFNYLFALIICLSFIVSTYSSSIFHSGLSADELGAKVIKAINFHRYEIVPSLIESGANINYARKLFGSTALIDSTIERHAETVELLLAQQGIQVNACDTEGGTAIYYAKDMIIVEMLLNCPEIEVNYVHSSTGRNALLYAIKLEQKDKVRALLASGKCDLSHCDNYGKTALTSSFNPEIREMIFEYMAFKCSSDVESDALNAELKRFELEIEYLDAARRGDYDRLLSALDLGVNVNATDNYTNTAMCLETSGNEAIFNLLISRGFDVNSSGTLIKHSLFGNEKMIKLLLKYPGIDVNIKDSRGRTALILACYMGNVEAVRVLLEDGRIDIFVRDADGCTAFDFGPKLINSDTVSEINSLLLHHSSTRKNLIK